MNDLLPDIERELAALSAGDQALVRDYIAFLRWRASQRERPAGSPDARPWQFNFLEHFSSADVRGSRDRAGWKPRPRKPR